MAHYMESQHVSTVVVSCSAGAQGVAPHRLAEKLRRMPAFKRLRFSGLDARGTEQWQAPLDNTTMEELLTVLARQLQAVEAKPLRHLLQVLPLGKVAGGCTQGHTTEQFCSCYLQLGSKAFILS